MSDVRRFSLIDCLLLALVLLAAGSARFWYLSTCADGGQQPGIIQVQGRPARLDLGDAELRGKTSPDELDALVANLKNDRWFGSLAPLANQEEQTAHVSPGYPWLVASLEKFIGEASATDKWLRWFQAGLGTVTAGLYFLFARRAFRSQKVGAMAGFFCALYPFFVCNTAELNDGTLATFLLAVVIFLGSHAGELGGAFTSLLFGLSLAAFCLVRAPALPFALVSLFWFCYRCRSLHRGWLYAFLAFLGFANGLAPWTLRNLHAYGEVVPIVDSAYLHLWEGNNPEASGGPLSEQSLRRAAAQAGTLDELTALPQPERYRRLARAVSAEIHDHPVKTLERRINAGLYFALSEEQFHYHKAWRMESGSDGNLPGFLQDWHGVLFYGALIGVLVLGFVGWRWTYGWRHESMPASLAILSLPLPYLLSHAEVLHGPRLPLDGVLLCYAAFALVALNPVSGGGLLLGSEHSLPADDAK